jgi:molecular chaperone DnaK
MSELIVGIDLGTTNSALAAVVDGKLDMVPIHGQPTLPSCVGVDGSGRLLVGAAARNQLVAAPESTLLSVKRRMGESVRLPLGDREYSPEEISACILRELKQEGEKALGQPIHRAVITVPAFFNEHQRKATHNAGTLAGLEVVRIINEPTAAALAYGAGHTGTEKLLVYDLGGGTFDVSVVVVDQGVVEVKSSHGDTHLGGDDFDQLLVNYATLEFQKRHGVDLHQDPRVLRRLKLVLEQAKCRLSDEPFVRIREEYVSGQHHLELELERDQYETMITPLLEKTLTCIHQSLTDAGLAPGDLQKVMLVGGATRTPLVQRLLQERLRLEPRWEINPDLIVALGAALQGAAIAGQQASAVLVDITPHTFSTATLADHEDGERLICAPIIHRNTPLPARKAERFFTLFDHQRSIEVTAYQGEGRLPQENTLIGKFMVDGLSAVPAGNPVVIQFDLDLNGMLEVTATEKVSGLARTVTMDTRSVGRLADLDQARRNLAALATGASTDTAETAADEFPVLETSAVDQDDDGDAEADPDTTLAEAKDLRKRGELLLTRAVNPEDADEIRALIHESASAIGARDWTTLASCNSRLSDLLFYLED